MHSRDYSDNTQHQIDEEVERILREQEERALKVLGEHRGGLEGVARALLDKETIDGEEVKRLVDEAAGYAVSDTSVPQLGNGSSRTRRPRRTTS